MDFKLMVDKIKNSKLFNKDLYLCSCFSINEQWQFDFYNKKTKRITSFVIEDNKPKILVENQKPFQKTPEDLKELNLSEVKISLKYALIKIDDIKKQKAPSGSISKKIMILQTQKQPIWNITYITSAFNVLNVKISAIDGKIISESFQSALSFKKP